MDLIELSVICPKCNKKNYFIGGMTEKNLRCNKCSSIFDSIQLSVFKGFVYVISNHYMPGLLKIGYTERPVYERISELSASTAVPIAFEIEAYFSSSDPIRDESLIHSELSEYRLPNSEFFSIDIEKCLTLICNILNREPIFLKNSYLLIPFVHKCTACKTVFEVRVGNKRCPSCNKWFDW